MPDLLVVSNFALLLSFEIFVTAVTVNLYSEESFVFCLKTASNGGSSNIPHIFSQVCIIK